MDDGSLLALAESWRDADPDPATRDALDALVLGGDLPALHELFDRPLGFGTAGIRGPLGPGPARINRVLVRRVAAGLAAHLLARAGATRPTVVVGRDARHRSEDFARDVIEVVSAAGVDVVGLDGPVPTPLLAFAARHLGTDAAVMVTASHNPAGDNGVKVYLEGGIQVVPPADAELAAAIADPVVSDGPGPAPGAVRAAPPEMRTAYLDAVAGLVERPPARPVRAVYTPLHGVGAELTAEAFARAGLAAPSPVPPQVRPDPAFPTVATPNPEDPSALSLAIDRARAEGADVVLAHDPDADRLAVAAPDAAAPSGWRILTGDEVGALLADHLLGRGSGPDRLVVDTVVASALVGRIAAAHGVRHLRTAPGFKWVMRPVLTHPEERFVFGYEPALGYAVGTHVLDKDGIAAAAVFVELLGALAERGLTVWDRLDDLALAHGLHVGDVWSRAAPAGAGPAWPHEVMDRLRSAPPVEVAGRAVERIEDLAGGPDGLAADMVVVHLAGGVRVAVRPSGTEPLVKYYAEVGQAVTDRAHLVEARSSARRWVAEVRQALDRLWS